MLDDKEYNNELLVDARNLTVVKDKNVILDRVSLKLRRDDFITVIGPNGAGKSTLLKCIMGFYRPTRGLVFKKPNLKIGYVPQRFSPEQSISITARKFLMLNNEKVPTAAIDEIVSNMGIEAILDKSIHVASGGQIQRILLARSLINKPDLLVLDEPAQGLDIPGQVAFYKLLDKLYSSSKVGILMVSHDFHVIMASTKKVICLFHHICCSGEPQYVTQHPEFASLFGNDMSSDIMAFYKHKHHK